MNSLIPTASMCNTHSVQDGSDELLVLAELVKSSADEIVKTIKSRGHTFPLTNQPFSREFEAIRSSPDVQKCSTTLIAAASQLIALVRSPPTTLFLQSGQFYIPACLRTAVELHVPEIIREAGPQGIHVDKIAAYTNVDPSKLARVLRLLATSHIFREVAPDTFAHNYISSVLDTGKSTEEILADPDAKHDGTFGVAALVEAMADNGFKAASYLPESFKDPEFARSRKPNKTSFNLAMKTDLNGYQWNTLSANRYKLRRFNAAMDGVQRFTTPEAWIEGFDWKSLPANSLVVDVGGGVGLQSLTLAKAFDHLKFIVQDQEAVLKEAPKFWETRFPEAIDSGRVQFQIHDFFSPQPVQQPAVFYLRMIMPDWPDESCIDILKHLRAAAGPNTQLVIGERLIGYACEDPIKPHEVPGFSLISAPPPLLPNFGAASLQLYTVDLHTLAMMNGADRTLSGFKSILEASGWLLEKVFMGGGLGSLSTKLICVPA